MIVRGLDKALSLDIRGQFCYSGGLGRMKMGFNKIGFYSKYAGIYSLKLTKNGKELSKMKHYRPTNPNTLEQFFTRFRFRFATRSWQLMSEEYRKPYNERAKRYKMTGYNLFISETLKLFY